MWRACRSHSPLLPDHVFPPRACAAPFHVEATREAGRVGPLLPPAAQVCDRHEEVEHPFWKVTRISRRSRRAESCAVGVTLSEESVYLVVSEQGSHPSARCRVGISFSGDLLVHPSAARLPPKDILRQRLEPLHLRPAVDLPGMFEFVTNECSCGFDWAVGPQDHPVCLDALRGRAVEAVEERLVESLDLNEQTSSHVDGAPAVW